MKLFLTTAVLFLMGLTNINAQSYYNNYNSTIRYGNGYSGYQSYSSPKRNTSVYTNRNYDGLGGYNSTTTTYRNGMLNSSSRTYRDPYSNSTTTLKTNYKTGRTTYKYYYK